MNSWVTDHAARAEADVLVDDDANMDVYCWRLEQLLESGYSRTTADALAGDFKIDMHQACELLARGCDERTAYLILS